MPRVIIIRNDTLKSDYNIEILKVLEESKVFRIIGKLTYRLTTCSYCHQHSMVRISFKTVYIRDIPFNNKPVIIQLAKQRFLCRTCHHSIIVQTRLVGTHTQISKHLRITIIAKLAKDSSISNINANL